MNLTNFYNLFHKKSNVQTRVINKENFTYSQLLKILSESLDELPKNLNILDFGCGVGTLSFYLARLGHTVVGVDVSSQVISICKDSSKILHLEDKTSFTTGQSISEIASDKKFDLIICIEVIEHIKDDMKLIEQFHDKLKRGGRIILSTPSINAPLHKMGVAKDFDIRVGHLRRYNPEKLVEMFNRCGFRVIRVVKTEGLIRNSLYLIPVLGTFIRFIKGPLVKIVTFIDSISLYLFGESDIFIVATRK